MNKKQKQERRVEALHACLGALLCHGIHPDVCRVFDPRTFDRWHYGVTMAHMRRRRTVMPPQLGQLLGSPHWTLDALLPGFMAHVIVEFPDATPRDHLVGGFFAVTLAPWLAEDRREVLTKWTDAVVHMTQSSEVADRLPNRGRTVLAAYDSALAMVAAWDERDTATEGAAE